MLTRLAGGLAVPATMATSVLTRRFGGRVLGLDEATRDALFETLAGAGVLGAATYDGLVALRPAPTARRC